jgi:hypothetical protein
MMKVRTLITDLPMKPGKRNSYHVNLILSKNIAFHPLPYQAVRQFIVLWGYLQNKTYKLTEMAIGAGSDEVFYPHLLLSSGDITRFSLDSLLHRPN